MKTIEYKKVSNFFNALSHPVRVEILAELLKGEKCVSDIRDLVKVRQPNVSQHLSLLRLNGIVDWHQGGKRKCYFLKEQELIRDLFRIFSKPR